MHPPPHFLYYQNDNSMTTRLYEGTSNNEKDRIRSNTSKTPKRRKRSKPRKANRKNKNDTNVKEVKYGHGTIQRWRIFGVEVDPDHLGTTVEKTPRKPSEQIENIPSERRYFTKAVLEALCQRIQLESELFDIHQFNGSSETIPNENENLLDVKVVRRSLDARKKRGRKNVSLSKNSASCPPRYTYVLDVDVSKSFVQQQRWKHQPGRCEFLYPISETSVTSDEPSESTSLHPVPEEIISQENASSKTKKKIIIVGAGPAGLFCAYMLAQQLLTSSSTSSSSSPPPEIILLERGQPVEQRGRAIGALIHRAQMDPDSNFAFGEGGAGTWSDGKLTTRIGRNSQAVRMVLETLVRFGAPEHILVEGSPHLGTDNLVKLLRNMRKYLMDLGAEVRFGAKVTSVMKKNGAVEGVKVQYNDDNSMETLKGDAVVLATGHSARDIYEEMAQLGVILEPKGFAAGFRVEHPQHIINQIQYGKEWSPCVVTGRKRTDEANASNTILENSNILHKGRLPVASYRLATNQAFDGQSNRGAYSFCMCPGGQIVPASTNPHEVCVNGMSFSKRDSVFANSALVVTVDPDDVVLEPYRAEFGVLAGIQFQREMEQRAAQLGGGKFVCPVQSVNDFMTHQSTKGETPSSSYRLGVRSGVPCHEIYPPSMAQALCHALENSFEKTMPGFVSSGKGILHSVETRTSSPVRISRSVESYEAIGLKCFYPAGEGAGFAGGIVSAAVDGMLVAEAILDNQFSVGSLNTKKNKKNFVGFDY